MVVESRTTVNLWESKAQECRAIRNFAKFHNRDPKTVQAQEVSDTSLGIEGWAKESNAGSSPTTPATAPQTPIPAGQPPTNGDGTGSEATPKPPKRSKPPARKQQTDTKRLYTRISFILLSVPSSMIG